MRRLLRWFAYSLAVVLVLVAVGALALRTEWAHDRARRLIESRASAALAADVRIGALTGSFWRGVTAGEFVDLASRPSRHHRGGRVDSLSAVARVHDRHDSKKSG
jgi:hypothetical protein